MAITIKKQIDAGLFLPSSNPINVTVDSNNNGKCNFRYVCDIYLDDVKVFRYKLFPDPLTGYAFFQLNNIIDDYLKEYMPVDYDFGLTRGLSTTSKSSAKVYLKFGEEYDSSTGCDGDIDLYINLLTSNTFYSFYAAFDYKDWVDYKSTDYANYITDHSYAPSIAGIKYLTNRPIDSAECTFNNTYYLDYLCSNGTNTNLKLYIELDDGTQYTKSLTTLTGNCRMRIACGPFNINEYFEDSIINQSVKYYDVWLSNDYNPPPEADDITQRFRIKVTKPTKYRTRIGFIGLLGSPEYITFYHRDIKSYDIERNNFKNYLTSKSGDDWTYAVGDRETQTWATNAKESHKVSTFVNTKEAQWLSELWLTNNAWVEDRPFMTSFETFYSAVDLGKSTPGTPLALAKMYIRVPDGHNLKVGDYIYLMSDTNPSYADYNGKFEIEEVNGNIIDCGLTYNVYNLTRFACGWLVLSETPRTIPIVIDDSSVEVKEKTGGLIQYSLYYKTSVDKITLRS